MDCHEVRAWLATRRDLSWAQEREVQSHLVQCAECAAVWRREERIVRQLRMLPTPRAGLPEQRRAAMHAAIAGKPLQREPWQRSSLALALVVFCVLLFGGYLASTNVVPLLSSPTAGVEIVPTSAPTSFSEKVDVGGYRLFIRCAGEGSPAVIMDANLGDIGDRWLPVWREVQTFTRVCVYDRAGVGRSDPGPEPRTTRTLVRELHTLLTNAGVPGPYVLVGHYHGSLNVSLYASQYPDQVVGLVLVDPVPPNWDLVMRSLLEPAVWQDWVQGLRQNPEGLDMLASLAQVRTAALPDIPLIVLTPGKVPRWPPISADWPSAEEQYRHWRSQQAELAAQAPQGKQMIAENSDYYIQRDQPELVVDAIREIVEAVRKQE